MKICFITSNPRVESVRAELEKLGELRIHNRQGLTPEEAVELAADCEILAAGPSGIARIGRELIDRLPKLKFIALLTVGFDWIDIDYAKSRGIVISSIKGANSESVAEHAWGMILDLAKRISEFDRDARSKGSFRFQEYKGKEVYGKTIGIIGLGDIGKKIARIARGFDMEILGINRSGRPVDNVKLVGLDELLVKSDVIAICTPLTEETKNMVTEKEIGKMKPGVIIVNTSREEMVDKLAIIEAVKRGKVFGYGVETPVMTPVAKNDPYYDNPRILVTPHNAFNTEDADLKSYRLISENIAAWISGSAQNVVSA